ncbi:MAG: transposase [Anaerolineales bacterium]|nr:transposase [Anaerolineales bacterium]
MARMKFIDGARFKWADQVFWVKKTLLDQKLLLENETNGGEVQAEIDTLQTALYNGELCFEIPDGLAHTDEKSKFATEFTIADFESLPPKHQEEAFRRYQLILPLLKMPREERTRQAIVRYLNSLPVDAVSNGKRQKLGMAKSRASLERWLNDFENGNYDVRAFVPYRQPTKLTGVRLLDPEVEKIISDVLEDCSKHREKRKYTDVYFDVVFKISEDNKTRPELQKLKQPSKDTVYRRIKSFGSDKVLRRRAGRHEQNALRPTFTGLKATRILEIVELDNVTPTILLFDDKLNLPLGVPTLQLGEDWCSRYFFGMDLSFEAPSYKSTMRCLLHGIMKKAMVQQLYGTKNPCVSYGLPEMLVTDNGSEYNNRHLNNACAELGITIERNPVKMPGMKGGVERLYRTAKSQLIDAQPGSDFTDLMEKADYNPKEYAVLTLSDFMSMLYIYLLDIYAVNYHRGVKGIPLNIWNDNIRRGFVPAAPSSLQALQISLFQTERRRLNHYGIEFENLRYQSEETSRILPLVRYDQLNSVKIKVNPSDMDYIYVLDPTDNRTWLKYYSMSPNYTNNLSLWSHRFINKVVYREKGHVEIEALAEAKNRIKKIVQRRKVLNKLSARNRRKIMVADGMDNPDVSIVQNDELISALGETRTNPKLPAPQEKLDYDALPDEDISDQDVLGGDYNLPS